MSHSNNTVCLKRVILADAYAWKLLRPPLMAGMCGCSVVRYGTYFEGRWNYPIPGCGPLCVFRSWNEVQEFGLCPGDRLYLCAVTFSDELCVWDNVGESSVPRGALAPGTLLCKRVKCLARVRMVFPGSVTAERYRAISIATAEQRMANNYYNLRKGDSK